MEISKIAVNGSTYDIKDTNTVTSINGKTGAIEASDIASVLTDAGYKLTDTDSTGTVTSITAGTGLDGGTITTSGTLSVVYGTTAGTACQGNDSRLSDARPASDVSSWAKATTKPSYAYSEISGTPSSLPASDVSAWAKASTKPTYIANEVMSISKVTISANKSSSCSITGSSNAGKAQTIIYTNSKSADYTVTVPTTYKTPDGAAIELTCKAGGYCEVSYLNIDGTIYARGL